MQDADQIDNGVLVADQVAQRSVVMHVTFDDINRRQQDQMARPRPPRVGTVTRRPRAISRATMWRPMKPAPPMTRMSECCIRFVPAREFYAAPGTLPLQLRKSARYGNSVVPAAFGAIVPRRAFNDGGDALASNNAE